MSSTAIVAAVFLLSPIIPKHDHRQISVDPGGVFMAVVRLRLPLTPPPGVQRKKATDGWFARLVRPAMTPLDPEARTEYPLTVIRIRPHGSGNQTYGIVLLTRPWILPGIYDLDIIGPGFAETREDGVRIVDPESVGPGPPKKERAVSIEPVGRGGYRVIPATFTRWVFDIRVPSLEQGLRVALDGHSLIPSRVSWAERDFSREEGETVMRFETGVGQPDENGLVRTHLLTLTPMGKAPCRGSIQGQGEDFEDRRLLVRELSFEDTGTTTHTVIWDFGDGKKGVGNPVRHRWLLFGPFRLEAIGFDQFGRACRAVREIGVPRGEGRCCGFWMGARKPPLKLLEGLGYLI